jgi:hypothetical protein
VSLLCLFCCARLSVVHRKENQVKQKQKEEKEKESAVRRL